MCTAKRESWQRFCSEASSPKEMARLSKILQRNKNNTLGLLQAPSGLPADNPEHSLNLLLDEHFPGSEPDDDLITFEEDSKVCVTEGL